LVGQEHGRYQKKDFLHAVGIKIGH
jgi:hypothetical protein